MLRRVSLVGFKCFLEPLELALRPLTVLAGINGGGKSSAFQPLLLVHQQLQAGRAADASLALNGPILTLGTARDVMHRGSRERALGVAIEFDNSAVRWRLGDRGDRAAQSLSLLKTVYEVTGRPRRTTVKELLPRSSQKSSHAHLARTLAGLRYVPADRLGAAATYPLLDPGAHRALGPRAERAVGALWHDERPVAPGLRHPKGAKDGRLARQVEMWLCELFPETVLEVLPVPGSELATLRLRTSPGGEFDGPFNVGFGVTYVLPVIVALIGAVPGEVVVLDNPEAHLHPHAQATLGRICAQVARAGVQVIVETHCDHLLNGVRVAAHHGEIEGDDVIIHFFDRPGGGRQQVHEVRLGPGQRYTTRPELFFDETERQLRELLT